ncbi:MAG: LacI family DNA-binding transcriptional regulator [Roseburia sp.]|nr:LacI family DNA-binding transcriptional regulator [Roseburia sp.]MCM1242088.1 LacI family DNA-binding transcriptional regulator [Roseburia sp.]
MAKAVKMADIAKKIGVSTVTVSKALSNQKGVSEELRARIKTMADEMGYKTSSAIYQERVKMDISYNIGVVISGRFLDKYESFYWKLYQEVAKAAVQKGCFTLLEVLETEDERDCIMPKLLQEKRADGLLIIGLLEEKYLERLHEYASVPVIYLDFYDKKGACDAVISNSYFGMYKMTNYLFDMGHRDIGFVGTLWYTESITDRYFGYAKSMLEHGVSIRQDWVLDDRDPASGRTDGGFEIQLPQEMPTAFVCNCDVAAALLIRKLKEKGYRVPQDISVVGYDNYQPPGLCDIRITSYEVDMAEMAKKTVRNIIRKISGEHYKQGVLIIEGRIAHKDSVAAGV